MPGRYYLTTLRGVLLKGNGLDVLARDIAALAIFAAGLLAHRRVALPPEARVKIVLVLLSLLNVMKKELSQTMRDRRMLATLIVSPVLQLVVFGYAIDLDVDRIPTVVCDQDGTPASRDLTQAFFADRTFLRSADVSPIPSAAQDALEAGGAAAALIVPRGFARARRARGRARGAGHHRRDRRDARAGRVGRGEPVLAPARDRRRAGRAACGRRGVARARG